MHCEALREDELSGLCVGEGPYTLVELPFTADARFAELLLGMHYDVQSALLAHPERCRAFHEDPDLLGRLVDRGMLAQVTAASLVGSFGSTVQRCAWMMLEQGFVHVIASDAHDAVKRPPLMREPLEAAGLAAIVTLLCEETRKNPRRWAPGTGAHHATASESTWTAARRTAPGLSLASGRARRPCAAPVTVDVDARPPV